MSENNIIDENIELKDTKTKKVVKKTKKTKVSKKNLVIVESPAKAKTIKKFLGSSYKIEASMGHVRDLPKSQMAIDIENDFEPKYITIRGKGELLAKLRKEVKNSSKVYLATDPDREGEAISWHLMNSLNFENKQVERITFNEITKNAVKKSIKQARKIDMDLVDAQQARRVLDRIVGYTISGLLWKKVKSGLSAGRVQSVALKIICDREDEIRSFIPKEYWSIDAEFKSNEGKSFCAKFYGTKKEKIELNNELDVKNIVDKIKDKDFIVNEIKTATRTKKPIAPFTTSTLQQEASKHINMTTQKTMMVAQQLYEGVDIKGHGTLGLVSYIRTDSVRISDDAYEDAKSYILENYDEKYLNPERIVYKSKGKTQDAHEAIRPTHTELTPDSIKDSLTKEQYKLYKLIWERFIASQMSPALYETHSIKILVDKFIFKVSGSILKFKGFLEVYNKNNEDEDLKIPDVLKGDKLNLKSINPLQHFTQPPARYTDASLVKTLEEVGVGRPSTYAPTLTTILARNYVTRELKILYPTELGEIINDIMKKYFSDIVNVDFTANMESDLDKVEEGNLEWKQIIRDFYPDFNKLVSNAQELLEKVEIKDEVTDIICEKCGKNMVIKYGRYGKFLACPAFPECSNTKPFYEDALVKCPKCGGKVLIKKTKKGRRYYGCENSPECDFMSWNKPSEEKCPKCGSFLEERGKKNIKLVCTNENCGYVTQKKEENKEELV